MTNYQIGKFIQGLMKESVKTQSLTIPIDPVYLAADLLKLEGRLNPRGLAEVVGVQEAKNYFIQLGLDVVEPAAH